MPNLFPPFDAAEMWNSLYRGLLAVGGTLGVGFVGAKYFTRWWDERKVKYDLFKEAQLKRISQLQIMKDCFERADNQARFAMQRTIELKVNIDRQIDQDVLQRLGNDRRNAEKSMNEALAEARAIAVEYGGLPEPHSNKAMNLLRFIDSARQHAHARINNAAGAESTEAHRMESEVSGEMGDLLSLAQELLECEMRILLEAKMTDPLEEKVFRKDYRVFAHPRLLDRQSPPESKENE